MLELPTGVQDWWTAKNIPVTTRESHLGVVARCKVPTLLKCQGRHRSFFRVSLWDSKERFRAWWRPDGETRANGAFVPSPVRISYKNSKRGEMIPTACLGTVHLCQDHLTIETIVHECQHVLWRRMRAESPHVRDVLAQSQGSKFWSGRAEEEVAHDAGHWPAAIIEWLREISK